MGKGSVFRAMAVLAFGGCLGIAGYCDSVSKADAIGTSAAIQQSETAATEEWLSEITKDDSIETLEKSNTAEQDMPDIIMEADLAVGTESLSDTEESEPFTEDTEQALDSDMKKESADSEKEQPVSAQEGQVTQEEPKTKQRKTKPVTDLGDTFDVILKGAAKEFIAGYPIDETFLLWLNAQYGDEMIADLATCISDGTMQTELWHDIFGKSMHILWMQFCDDMGYQRELLDEVYEKESLDKKQTVLAFAGSLDLSEDSIVSGRMAEQPEEITGCISNELLSEMQNADIMQIGHEFAYGNGDEAFLARADKAALLAEFGTDLVTLMDHEGNAYGADVLQVTQNCLIQEQIPYIGAGETVFFEVNGKKIAYVSAARSTKETQALDATAAQTQGTSVLTQEEQQFVTSIAEAKKSSDYVIAIAYWGTEGALYADASQKNLAQECARAGADAVIGCHSHRLQGAAYVEGVPVVYGLGNFRYSDGTLYTALAQLVISENGSLSLRYLPCVQEGMQTRLLTDEQEKQGFYHYLASISSNVGIDAMGNVYNKAAENYPADSILYVPDMSTTLIRGVSDNEGRAIDSVGNLK